MAILGNLQINLRANAAHFITTMDRARDRQRQMARQTQALSASMRGLGRAALGIVGVAGLGAMISRTVQSADQMQKLSIKLNESVENLSRMQYVANRSGVDFRAFGMSLQRMNRRIAEAAAGSGEAKDVLKDLGINARELNVMTPVQQFLALTEAMKKIPNEANQLRFAFKIFDSEGVANLQIMRNGVSEIVRLMAESDTLGATLTKSQADTAAAAADEMTKLQSTFQGTLNTAVGEFGPGIILAMNSVMKAIPHVRAALDDAGRFVGHIVIQIERAMRAIDLLSNVWDKRQKSGITMDNALDTQRTAASRTAPVTGGMLDYVRGALSYPTSLLGIPEQYSPVNLPTTLGMAAGGVIGEVMDPQNKEIIRLLGRMLESLTTDRTAVAG